MHLSSAIASLAMLTIAATAEWVTIKPETIKCMKDFPWDHCPSTWKEMDDVPQGKCDPVDPVSENETSGGSPTVDDCFALGHNLPKGKGWVRIALLVLVQRFETCCTCRRTLLSCSIS
jgi:hypothetical protein